MWKWCYLALAHDGVHNEKSGAVVKLGAAFHKLRHVHNHWRHVIVQKCVAQRSTQVSQQSSRAQGGKVHSEMNVHLPPGPSIFNLQVT